jgi:hypothetical protein
MTVPGIPGGAASPQATTPGLLRRAPLVDGHNDLASVGYLARREAGAIRYVSHEEAGLRLGVPSR